MNNTPENNTKPRAMTKKELAAAYGITRKTLNAWLREANINFEKQCYTLTPCEVKQCFDHFGQP